MIKMRTVNFHNVKTKFCIFIVVFLITMGMLNMSSSERANLTSFDTFRTAPVFSTVSNGNDTIIGTPAINPTSPTSNDPTDVSLLIADTDGIQNATLVWQYNTINSTLYNTTMSNVKTRVVDETQFSHTGYITDTGYETTDTTEYMYGEYSYETIPGEVLTEIDVRVTTQQLQNSLTYVLVEAKNSSTGIWGPVMEVGAIGETIDLGDVDYLSTTFVTGYRIYAITYQDDASPFPLKPPEFDHLYIYREEYSATIPAANQPTFVSYNITAFDMLNNSATSDTFTFLMDWAPEVTILDLPLGIQTNQDFVMEVNVTDLDGVADINDNSVTAYYRLEGETDWSGVNLVHLHDISDSAFYNGTIPAQSITNEEKNLYLMVNASDLVGGELGYEGSTGVKTILIDSLNPRVTSIIIEDGVTVPGLENVTLVTSEVNITTEFTDPAGISSVSIYYSISTDNTFLKKEMTNLTSKEPNLSPVTFFVTLPPSNDTAFVEYFFESTDYLGNVGNSSVNLYYADGSAPLLDTYLLSPVVISNLTDVIFLFNASDYSDLLTSVLWYSFDNGTSWTNTIASPIDYSTQIDYQETFTAANLPFLIADNALSSLQLDVVRGAGVDSATLTLGVYHEKPTDLRIWLRLYDGRRFLIFDREPSSTTFTRDIDLLALGLEQADFTRANFTLEIQDFSELYSGSITDFTIELKHYSVPLGYQFMATLPSTGNDTTVLYYITLTDRVYNAQNTSVFSYYADGLAPQILVQSPPSPLDLSGGYSIRLSADISDAGGVLGADIYYKFSQSADWIVSPLSYDSMTGFFIFDVPISTGEGTLLYRIRAFDVSGLSSESALCTIDFTNAFAPIIIVQDTPFPSPLDMQGTQLIRIRANVTDDETIESVKIHYRFSTEDDWNISEMSRDLATGYYYFDVLVLSESGNLTFKITATDNSGLTSETDSYTINFENAKVTPSTPSTEPLFVITALLGLGVGGAVVIYLFLRKTGRWSKRNTNVSTDLPSPPQPDDG